MTTTKSGGILGMTGNYNANSKPQLHAIERSIPFIRRAIDAFDFDSSSSSPLIIADFGSAHGANSIYAMKIIIDYFRETKKDIREFLVVHNDLPTNDWTSVFQLLTDNNSYSGVASGRSFYEQCLPRNSLSIGYCTSSIHWLSKKPCNFSDSCEFFFASGDELALFKSQARLDYIHFLEHRSRELLPGGVLILIINSVNNQEKSEVQEEGRKLFHKCAQSLPLTRQELLDYTFPCYFRSYEECVDEKLFARCSLEVIESELCAIPSKMYEEWQDGQLTLDQFARGRTQFGRSATESVLREALEMSKQRSKEEVDQLLDQFWAMYEREVKERPHEHNLSSYRTYLVLKKMPNP